MTARSAEVTALDWYHTIELPGGVLTPGFYDHRPVVGRLPIPPSLSGMRCLDVGSSDGFWAFEMWRRGAAEVVSVDLDDPARQEWQGPARRDRGSVASTSGAWEGDRGRTGRAFELARSALGADVSRLDLSVYDLSPEIAGSFDFVFMGSLLLHLRDPAGALAAVRSVVAGRFLLFEPILLSLSLLFPRTPLASLWQLDEPRWWLPNRAGLRRLVEAAGFDVLSAGGPCAQKFGRGFPRRPPRRTPTLSEVLFWTVVRPLGVPSAWVLAEPPGPGTGSRARAKTRVPLLGWV
jgi:tRNA (mo5U34)-methyltransferase